MKSALAILGVCVAFAAGDVATTDVDERSFQRIVGGTPTTINQYPFAVVVQRGSSSFSHWCGGSILTSSAVLTAAHCLFSQGMLPASQFRLRMGSSQASSGGTTYFLRGFVIHPQYNSNTINNDVAVMQTSTNINFISGTVARVSIAGANYNIADNSVVTAIGWGTTQSPWESSETLRHVQLCTINQSLCAQRYATRGLTITSGMMCSGILNVGGKDQCQGDSGGPLLHNNVQVGVCSWGLGCADPFFPGVNARVSQYSNWIQSTAQ